MSMKLLVIFSLITSAAQAYDPTSDLMFAFGSQCRSRGPVSALANKQTGDLKTIIENIRNDDKSCSGVIGALNDIQNLNIPNLLNEKTAENDIGYLSQQANELELAVQSESSLATPDAAYVTALKAELVTTKVNIAKSQKFPNQEKNRRRLETISNFQQYSNALLSRLRTSDQCLTKNPNVSVQIGAQLLGLGSTLASGVVGSLMLATGTMVDNLVSYFRDRGLAEKMKNVVNNQMGEAIGCTFEGLSYTYCQARDVETVIKFNKNQVEKKSSNKNDWQEAVGIIGQDQQSYLEWITAIDAGSPASTIGRAIDKASGDDAQNELRKSKKFLDGTLNSAIQTIADSDSKINATRNALNDLAEILEPKSTCSGTKCTSSGPFTGSFTENPTCGMYFYLYSKGAVRTGVRGQTQTCGEAASAAYPVPPDISVDVRPVLAALYTEAQDRVNIQNSLVNESNPDLAIAKIDAKSKNRRTAREFMKAAESYLENLLKDPQGIAKKPTQKNLIDKTLLQIKKALEIVDRKQDPVDPNRPKGRMQTADPSKKTIDLSNELIPQGTTSALPDALSEIINQDIDHKISMGQVDENLATLIELTSNTGLGELIRYYIGLEAANTQSRSAKRLTKNNLSAMASVFDSKLEEHFKKLSEDKDPDSQESLAYLCMQTLSVPESPKIGKVNVEKYCSKKIVKDFFEGSGINMNYDNLAKKDYPERACAVYDHHRKSYLYGLKNNRGTTQPVKVKTQQ